MICSHMDGTTNGGGTNNGGRRRGGGGGGVEIYFSHHCNIEGTYK